MMLLVETRREDRRLLKDLTMTWIAMEMGQRSMRRIETNVAFFKALDDEDEDDDEQQKR